MSPKKTMNEVKAENEKLKKIYNEYQQEKN